MTPRESTTGPKISLVTATLKAGQGLRLGPATILLAGKGHIVVCVGKTRLEVKLIKGRQAACVCSAEDGPHPIKIESVPQTPLVVLGQGTSRRAIYPRDLDPEESDNVTPSSEPAGP